MNIFQKPICSLIYMPNHSGNKKLEPNSWLKLVFGLMTPPKEGVFTNIEKNFAETLQFEDLAVIYIYFFTCIFLWRKSWIGIKCIFYECGKINIKHFAEKSNSVFEGLEGGPSNTLKKNCLQNVFFFYFFFIFVQPS